MLALWAESNLVLADQLRDGNVPAIQEPLNVARRAFEALPEGIEERYFRGDAACYESDLLSWLRDPKRPTGPKGFIGFAVSVPLIAPMREAIWEVPEANCKLYREDEQAQLDCARVEYYPEEKPGPTYGEPLR